MRLSFFTELGYKPEEVEELYGSCSRCISEYLEYNHLSVYENLKCIQGHIDKHLLLKMPILYPDAFCLKPTLFAKRINALKEVIPDDGWAGLLTKQVYGCWGKNGYNRTNYRPFLEVLALSDEDVQNELDLLAHPDRIIFDFMEQLKEVGIEVEHVILYNNLLWDLEVSRFQLVENAVALLGEGLDRFIIEDIIIYAPLMLTLPKTEVHERLIKGFGDDYVRGIINAYINENFEDIIEEIGW